MPTETVMTKPVRDEQEQERIAEALAELKRRHETAKDFNVPADNVRMTIDEITNTDDQGESVTTTQPHLSVRLPGLPPMTPLGISPLAHQQLGTKLGIHGTYYRRMLDEAPELMAYNANHWLAEFGDSIKIRELDGDARAILSPSYRALDNYPLMIKAAPVIAEAGAEIIKLELSDTRMYVKSVVQGWGERIDHQHRDVEAEGAVFQQWLAQSEEGYFHRYTEHGRDVPDEDWIIPGAILENSEVGRGGLTVKPFFWRVICRNGTTMDVSFKRIHIGAKEQDGLVTSDRTRAIENDLIFSQVTDAFGKIFDRDNFRQLVQSLTESTTVTLGDAPATIENVSAQYNLTNDEQQSVINRILHGGDPTVFGMVQAVTSLARDTTDVDRRNELEAVGGHLIEDGRELVRVRR